MRTLEILSLRDGGWTVDATHKDAEVVRADPFAAIELLLKDLWLDAARHG